MHGQKRHTSFILFSLLFTATAFIFAAAGIFIEKIFGFHEAGLKSDSEFFSSVISSAKATTVMLRTRIRASARVRIFFIVPFLLKKIKYLYNSLNVLKHQKPGSKSTKYKIYYK